MSRSLIFTAVVATLVTIAVWQFFVLPERGSVEDVPAEQEAVAEQVSLDDGADKSITIEQKELLPSRVRHNVPFTAQAPLAQWDDRRYQNACEEASILMARHWLGETSFTPQQATREIAAMVAFEEREYGFFIDSSAADTARLFQEYYREDAVTLDQDVSVERIREQVAQGNLVIVPVDGRALGNPYFVQPGPDRHMVVVIGYDNIRRVFITNDPGTRRGAKYEYAYDVLFNAIRDYRSGDHEPIVSNSKVMIVVEAR